MSSISRPIALVAIAACALFGSATACDLFDVIEAKTFMDGSSVELSVTSGGMRKLVYVDNSLDLATNGLAPQFRLDGEIVSPRSDEMQQIQVDLESWLVRSKCEEVVRQRQTSDPMVNKCMLAEGVIQFLSVAR